MASFSIPNHRADVAPDTIAQILRALKSSGSGSPQTVGVFVNTPVEAISAILDATGLDLAQLHGDEPEEAVAALQGRGFKAVRPADAAAAVDALRFARYPFASAPQLLVDAYHPTLYGGSGHMGDWTLAEAISSAAPRLMLAGGLTPDNVPRAVAAVRPWAVDVAGGVEVAPGRKDHAKIRDFIAAAHASPVTP